MKLFLSLLFLLFQAITISADKNWIPITPLDKDQTPKPTKKLDVNLSQIEPINKMMKNVTVVQQLIEATSKKEKPATNDKNWFVLNTKETK